MFRKNPMTTKEIKQEFIVKTNRKILQLTTIKQKTLPSEV